MPKEVETFSIHQFSDYVYLNFSKNPYHNEILQGIMASTIYFLMTLNLTSGPFDKKIKQFPHINNISPGFRIYHKLSLNILIRF